ncbi:solute carrier organic anion transporter family member 3A1-like [Argopecten irradians]|uniref:solute carrier organic anion transporter family member 3A1-like n=1 Tax=Argopecten irradians TaxID=31199 RepID=UPI003722A04A
MEESNRFISPPDRKEVMRAEMKSSAHDPETQCGTGACKPKCMTCCSNISCFTAFYSMAGLFTSTISMYVTSQVTTLERYFGFSSSHTGFIMSCNDIGFLLTTIFVSHAARRVHIPRVLSVSTIVFGVSGILCTLAYFLSPTFMTEGQGLLKGQDKGQDLSIHFNATSSIKGGQLCDGTDKVDCLNVDENIVKVGAPTSFTPVALTIIAIGMILQGFAKSPRQPFLTCYIDDNVKKTDTGMYLGIIMALSIFGPAIAFGLGGFFSKVYVTLEDVYITPRDPRWVGAWWVGFLLFGFLAILSGIPVFFFPRRFKPKPVDHSDGKSGFMENLKDIFKGVGALVTNKLYMLVVLANCLTLFMVGGFLAFMPKYMEAQFQIPAWFANIVMGIIGVFAAALGSFLGGCLVTKLKLTPIACAKLILGISAFAVIIPILGYFLGCDNPEIIGFNVQRPDGDLNCTNGCQCDDTDYFPICGSDGKNYFSPCHAGCSNQQGQVFVECACLGVNGTATPGLCDTDCKMLAPFMCLAFFGGLVATMAGMPSIIFSIRCVTDKQKSLAVGLSSFLQTLLGWFPGPIVIGMVTDTSCLTWSTSCRGKGACSMYDIYDLRLKRHMIEIAFKLVTLCMHIAMFVIARRTDWSQYGQEGVLPEKPEAETLMITNGKTKAKWTEYNDPIVKKR